MGLHCSHWQFYHHLLHLDSFPCHNLASRYSPSSSGIIKVDCESPGRSQLLFCPRKMRSHFLADKVTNGQTFGLCQGRIVNVNWRLTRSYVDLIWTKWSKWSILDCRYLISGAVWSSSSGSWLLSNITVETVECWLTVRVVIREEMETIHISSWRPGQVIVNSGKVLGCKECQHFHISIHHGYFEMPSCEVRTIYLLDISRFSFNYLYLEVVVVEEVEVKVGKVHSVRNRCAKKSFVEFWFFLVEIVIT